MENTPLLVAETTIRIRFSEVDALRIVWHGHYIQYFEDAREAFGQQFGIDYETIHRQGFTAPVVHLDCDYKKPLVYGDTVTVQCAFVPSPAAKMIFRYRIIRENELIAEAETTQVFLDSNGVLQLYAPEFFTRWKQEMGITA